MNVRGLTVLNRKRNRKIAALRYQIAGKAKYKRMIELDNTMLFVYANPEPMLGI